MWIVGYSATGAEGKLKDWLEKRGTPAYVPLKSTSIRPRRSFVEVTRTSPLFQHYVFIDYDGMKETVASFAECKFLWGLLMMGETILEIPEEKIEELKERESRREFDYSVSKLDLSFYVRGRRVSIVEGPLVNHQASIVDPPRGVINPRLVVDVEGLRTKISLSSVRIIG